MKKRFGKPNILFLVLSAILASMLWMYVMVVEDPETDTEVTGLKPTFIGEDVLADRKLSVVRGQSRTVSLTLRGRYTDLAKVNPEDIKLIVDLSAITTPGNHQRGYRVELPESIASRVTVWDRSTHYIDLTIDTIVSQPLEVRVIHQGDIAPGFIAEAPTAEPGEIKVTGPAGELSGLSYAEVVLKREQVDRTIHVGMPFTLRDIDGNVVDSPNLETDVTEVMVTLPVKMTKEVSLSVDFLDGGGITAADNILCTIVPSKITISGDPSVLEPLNIIKLGPKPIELSKLISDTLENFDIVIPNECVNLSGISVATVKLEIYGAESKQLDATNIEVVGGILPENHELRLITQSVPVTVRGPVDTVDMIFPQHLRIVVDLGDADVTAGMQTAVAEVTIDGYSNVGVVGETKISFEVVPISERPPDL